MPIKHAAIPTVYKNVQMRSRLEARWAAFFDLLGWRWEYEPIDLNGWIPDFVVHVPTNKLPWLVEVKPLKGVSPEQARQIMLPLVRPLAATGNRGNHFSRNWNTCRY